MYIKDILRLDSGYVCKNRSKGPVLIGLEEIVQRQVGVGWVVVGRGGG